MNTNSKTCMAEQELSDEQRTPASERNQRVVLTAGAGSGKTRTLVARYVGLLADGFKPDEVVAITFTDKAAREMRARIRLEVQKEKDVAVDDQLRIQWQNLEQKMDGARIGTIHSLCAEILRSHPAAAGLDPEFKVLDEAMAIVERLNAIQTAMSETLNDNDLRALYRLFKINALSDLLKETLVLRLDTHTWLIDSSKDGQQLLQEQLEVWFSPGDCREIVLAILDLSDEFLQQETTVSGCNQVLAFQQDWYAIEQLYAAGDYWGCFSALSAIRKAHRKGVGSKSSQSYQLMTAWFNYYDQNWKPLFGADAVDADLEALYFAAIPAIKRLIQRAEEVYLDNLRRQQSLDFDDLEQMALYVLQVPEIGAIWQQKVAALLVDEFQDTNARQQQIVEILCGAQAAKLFVVGDARQSIYRFRGADVSIFRNLEAATQAMGGLKFSLAETYRTHATLLSGINHLSGAMMQAGIDESNPHLVPFSAMVTKKKAPKVEMKPPFIEVLIGVGQNSDLGRLNSANLLVTRLIELKKSNPALQWQDIVLLFRASTTFIYYERELEKAGIPFVTVAGRGFYDRPEIRDLLNLLTALADPWDDLSLIGLLRSPAVAMSDIGITKLRWLNGARKPAALFLALQGDLSGLSSLDQAAAVRARALFATFQPVMGRKPVAEILQQLVVFSHYQAILAGSTERAWRNVEKLLADSAGNRYFSLHAYLEYVAQMNDSGAREGEAPGEAEEAVRLMTIHKAKGLEFPVVVLADFGRKPNLQTGQWVHLSDKGAAFKPGRLDYKPLVWRLLTWLDQERENAEDLRLLYVAMTRSEDMLILNGHASIRRGSYLMEGWLKDTCQILGIDLETILAEGGERLVDLQDDCQLRVQVCENARSLETKTKSQPEIERQNISSLLDPLENLDWLESETAFQSPADDLQPLVGHLLHRALQDWWFPHDEQDRMMLVNWAYQEGYYHHEQVLQAVEAVINCLQRLEKNSLFKEIDGAESRLHEVPFSTVQDGVLSAGRMDLLYKSGGSWHLLDFKSDRLAQITNLPAEVLVDYQNQLRRYARAIQNHFGEIPSARICFLNAGEQLELVEVAL